MENNNYHQPIENPANQPIDRPIKVKKPSNQALTMVIVGLVAALLAGVIMYLVMNEQVQKEKSLASKNSADAVRVVELEKEVKELEDRGATTVTGINNESGYEKFKKYCGSIPQAVPYIYLVTDAGEFGTCRGPGYMTVAKRIDGTWTEIQSGQTISATEQKKLNDNNVPTALYMTSCNEIGR